MSQNSSARPNAPITPSKSRSGHQLSTGHAVNQLPPNTPPPFTPRKADSMMRTLLQSPCANRSLTGAICAENVKLIICNAWKETDPVHDPVLSIKHVVNEILKNDPTFASFPVEVTPYQSSQPHPATCYVALQSSVNNSIEPRWDLLEHWQKAIKALKPALDVAWMPSCEGSDKFMWIQMPAVTQAHESELTRQNPDCVISDEPKNASHLVSRVTEMLTTENIPYYTAFSVGHTVIVELILTSTRSQILEHGFVHIPSISSLPLPITADAQLTILHRQNFSARGFIPTALTMDLPFVMNDHTGQTMTSTSSCQVLKLTKLFEEQITTKHPDITLPQLLYTFNSNPAFRKKNTDKSITDGANKVACEQKAETEALKHRIDHDRIDTLETKLLKGVDSQVEVQRLNDIIKEKQQELDDMMDEEDALLALTTAPSLPAPPSTSATTPRQRSLSPSPTERRVRPRMSNPDSDTTMHVQEGIQESRTIGNEFTLVIIVCLLALSLLNTVNVIHSSSTFSIYSLNANGLGHAVKLQHINTAIRSAKPHLFILNESKTKASIIKDLPHNDYEILEERTVKCQDPALLGRVLAADIAIQTSNGQAFNHRIIGVYAPWDPGSPDSLNFWPALTNFIQTSNVDSWSLAGDLNATINSNERASGGADA
ncbi:hypothetical protein BDP27DRAFT_1368399 [Rhodocollybia butyracea]|uniref:Endonuclease/exonuclease/phosphatase domain-containing protein n=1 Tax=Rhodocollybia butyracea TaxID=206335 RepID=A0A9P5U205_9AGAR|nr:hypothetical protein BDP27DRAFT_1368399 [Rhodocollybia butyracea]